MKLFEDSIIDKDGYVVLNAPYLEMYIPSSYEEEKMAVNYGSYINVMGVFNLRMFDGDNKPGQLEMLNLPTRIDVYPADFEVKTLSLDGKEPEKFIVCKFYNQSKIMKSELVKNDTYVSDFVNLVIKGKLPRTIPYDKLLAVWMKNMSLNGVGLGVPPTVLSMIIREVYRNPKTNEPFAREFGRNLQLSPLAYTTANMRTICSMNSTFAALTFEDFTAMVTASLNRETYKRSESKSPLEDLLKM